MSNEKKGGSKFPTIVITVVTLLFLWGFVTTLLGAFSKKENDPRTYIGWIIIGAAILIRVLITLMPAKLRGVEKQPFKVRILQILQSLSFIILIGGLVVMFYFTIKYPDDNPNIPALYGAGIFLFGFVSAPLSHAIIGRLIDRGEASPDANDDLNTGSEPLSEEELNKGIVIKGVDSYGEDPLSDEERERELRRIEEQEQVRNSPMTREQVELHEDIRHNRK